MLPPYFHKSQETKYLSAKGLISNDDMSGVILRSYHRKINDIDINIEQQINDIQQWYVNMNIPEWRAKQDSISWTNFMTKFSIGDTLTNHVYYDRNWLGEPRKNVVILATIADKSERQIKINIISFGGETDKELIYQEIKCESSDCWINPYWWEKKDDKDE